MTDERAFYRRYLRCCNEHRFDELGEFVHDDVRVNDAAAGLRGYVTDLDTLVAAVPDYFWDLRHLLVDGSLLSAYSIGSGTSTGGQPVRMPEFTLYRIDAGRIAEVWGDLDLTKLP